MTCAISLCWYVFGLKSIAALHKLTSGVLSEFSQPSCNPLILVILMQLAFHDTLNSAMSAGCGVVVALLYWSVLSPLQSFRVPGKRLFTVSKCYGLWRVNHSLVYDLRSVMHPRLAHHDYSRYSPASSRANSCAEPLSLEATR